MSARSLNRVLLIGNLTRDPELRYTPQGTAVCTFGLATNRSWTPTDGGEPREETEFHRVVAWSKLAEICSQLLYKGRKVFVEGRLQTRTWQGNDGQERTTTEIVIDNMIALGAPKGVREDEGEYGGEYPTQAPVPVAAATSGDAGDATAQAQTYPTEPEVEEEPAAEEVVEEPPTAKKTARRKTSGKVSKAEDKEESISPDDVADDIPF